MTDYSPLLSAVKGELLKTLQEALESRKLIELRDYQEQARDAVIAEWEAGKRTMVAVATGGGKSEIFLSCAKWAYDNGYGRVLIIAHREELIFQPVERILKGWELPCPGIVMGRYRMTGAEIVVATVQTLARGNRLQEILDSGDIGCVIIDEFHRSNGSTYRKVIDEIYARFPNCFLLGVTATPRRSDEAGLAALVDSVAFRLSMADAIKRGILCPYESKIAQMGFTLEGLKRTKDGWDDSAVEKLMTASNALDVIVEKWLEEGENRPTLAFTATVKQAELLAQKFQNKGINAGFVSGETEKEERRETIAAYKRGEITVMCSMGVLTEGFDAPHTACIIMARPTSSGVLFAQVIGRGLRTHRLKRDCLILQFVPMEAPVDMFLVGDLLGKPKKQQKAEKKAKEAGVILDIFGVEAKGAGWEAEPDEIVMKAADIFGTGKNRNLAWTFDPIKKVATLSIGISMTIGIVPPHPAYVEATEERTDFPQWEKAIARKTAWKLLKLVKSQFHSLGEYDSIDEAHAAANEYLRSDHAWGRTRKSEWRKRPATPKREAFCRKLGIWRNGMTDGEASQAISHKLFMLALKND